MIEIALSTLFQPVKNVWIKLLLILKHFSFNQKIKMLKIKQYVKIIKVTLFNLEGIVKFEVVTTISIVLNCYGYYIGRKWNIVGLEDLFHCHESSQYSINSV